MTADLLGTRAPSGVLLAGIGNVFLGDDGFGVEVAHRLESRPLPEGTSVADYGIRGVHLAYDLLDGEVETLIMIDALPTGEQPGTVTLLEVDEQVLAETVADPEPVDSHSMHPEAVLTTLHALGGHVERVLVVGCQPQSVQAGMTLSDPVAAAVEPAADLALNTAEKAAAKSKSAAARPARTRSASDA
jgi:hydrogenase maturation protease